MTRTAGRFQDNKNETRGRIVYLVKPSDVEIDRARKYAIPNNLKHVHAYHPEFQKLIEFNSVNTLQINKNMRGKLFKQQNGLCHLCQKKIDLNTIIYSFKPVIHHIIPISEGGHPNKILNLVLLHKGCHLEIHGHDNKAD